MSVTNERSRGHEATDRRTIRLREEIAAGYLSEGGSSLTGYLLGERGKGLCGERVKIERGDTCEEVARITIRVPETA